MKAAKTGIDYHVPPDMSDPMRYTTRHRKMTDPQIVLLYRELRDSDAVAIRAGCSGQTVLGIVRAAGVPVAPRGGKPGRRRHLAIPDDEVARLYRAGMSCLDLALRAGCSTSTVYRILKEAKVERRGAFGSSAKQSLVR